MNNILSIIQVLIALLLIGLILLQEPSSGLGGLFGGSGEAVYQKRRGFSRMAFIATLVLTIIFIVISVTRF